MNRGPVLFLSAFLAAGCAAAADAPAAAADAANQDLIGGEAASGAKYDAVGALLEGESRTPFCTATLVAPKVIITAKHCIEGGSEEDPHPKDPKTVQFWFGDSIEHGALGAVTLKRWMEAPDFAKPEYAEYASDVTLAELEDAPRIPVIPIAKAAVTEADVGRAFDVVGFGVRSPDGFGEAEGEREVGSFVVEATAGNAFAKRFGSKARFDEYYEQIDPSGSDNGLADRMWGHADLHASYEVLARSEKSETCYSDSGGPLLRPTANGTLEVVGVVSTGFPGEASSCLHLGTVFAIFGPKTQQFLRAKGL